MPGAVYATQAPASPGARSPPRACACSGCPVWQVVYRRIARACKLVSFAVMGCAAANALRGGADMSVGYMRGCSCDTSAANTCRVTCLEGGVVASTQLSPNVRLRSHVWSQCNWTRSVISTRWARRSGRPSQQHFRGIMALPRRWEMHIHRHILDRGSSQSQSS